LSFAAIAQTVPVATDAEGVIRVGGTRVTLDTVVAAYMRGCTPEQIVQDYSSLDIADVYGVIAYYLRNRVELDAYLETRREKAQEVRKELEQRFPSDGLRDRLLSRLR